MLEERSVYEKTIKNYGEVIITLDKVLKERNMTVYRLSELTGVNWQIVKNYEQDKLYKADLDLLAKFCYVLNCDISDILYYCDEKEITSFKNNKNV